MASNGWEYVGKKGSKGKPNNKTNKKRSNEDLEQIESEGLFSFYKKYMIFMTRHSQSLTVIH